MTTTTNTVFMNHMDQHNYQKIQRDEILQNKILKIIQIHTFHLEQEIMELRRSLQEQQTEEEKLKKKIKEWEKKIRIWFEERNKNYETKRSTTPPPTFHNHKLRLDHDSFNYNNQIDRNNKSGLTKNNIRFDNQTVGHDSIRSLVASATKNSQGKKRKRITMVSTVQTLPTSSGKTQNISHHRIKKNLSQDEIDTSEVAIGVRNENEIKSMNDKSVINKLRDQSLSLRQIKEANNEKKQKSTKKNSNTSFKIKADSVLSNESISKFQHQSHKQMLNKDIFFQMKHNELKSNLLCQFISSQETKQQPHQNKNKHNIKQNKIMEKTLTTDKYSKDDTKTNNQHSIVKNPYKYKEVVRKQSDRRSLHAHACPECQEFLDAVCYKHNPKNSSGNEEIFDKDKLIQNCSRHRERFTPDPPTPDGFWELSFADSMRKRSTDEF